MNVRLPQKTSEKDFCVLNLKEWKHRGREGHSSETRGKLRRDVTENNAKILQIQRIYML